MWFLPMCVHGAGGKVTMQRGRPRWMLTPYREQRSWRRKSWGEDEETVAALLPVKCSITNPQDMVQAV